MSPRAYIVRRVKVGGRWVNAKKTAPDRRDDRRYIVRYRLGRGPALYAGSFRTEQEAEARRQWCARLIAEGRGEEIRSLLREPQRPASVLEALDAALAAIPRATTAQRKRFMQARAQLGALGEMPVGEVRRADVQRWIGELADRYKPTTVSQYLVPVRQAFDHAEVAPNPARDPRLRLPLADEDEEFTPPTRSEFEAIVGRVAERYRDVLILMEGTGLRIAEALALEWGDVDFAGSRIRVARSRTKGRTGGRRFVPMLMRVEDALRRQAPPDARRGTIFTGIADDGVRQAMARACERLGIAHFHPHDLRGRWISLCLIAGIPVELVARMAGHRRTSMTLDVYSHVVLDEPAERLAELRRGVRVVFGLTNESVVPDVLPANEGGDVRVEDTGIEPVTSTLPA